MECRAVKPFFFFWNEKKLQKNKNIYENEKVYL